MGSKVKEELGSQGVWSLRSPGVPGVDRWETTSQPCGGHSISCEEGSYRFPPWRPGMMGQAAQGVTHVGEDGGLAGVALCPVYGLACC